MNCKRCHHLAEAHIPSETSESLLKLGKCIMPDCSCRQYIDFETLDEELM